MSEAAGLRRPSLAGRRIVVTPVEESGESLSAVCPDCRTAYWGERANHCRGGKCGGCCGTYYGMGAWDRHRTGTYTPDERRCRSADEMRALGMWTDDNGWWHLPAKDETEDTE